jgi:hypothetical protein
MILVPRSTMLLSTMSYQYLFCATCGQRRTGHGYSCSVCGSTLRRPDPKRSVTVVRLQPLVRIESQREVGQPVAA